MFAPETVEKVLCHLLRFGSSRADAEDLAQEALLIAWRERATFDASRSLDGWLYGIARNVFRNHTRRQRRSPIDIVDDPDATQASPSLGDVLTLQRALHALPENQQDIVILHELEGHTLKETAELLEIPFDTAKDRLKRARATLETACGAQLDASVRAEKPATRRVATLAVASVLAGLLGAIAKEGGAIAAGSAAGATAAGSTTVATGAAATSALSKALLIAMLAGGIVVGVIVDRIVRPAETRTTAPLDAGTETATAIETATATQTATETATATASDAAPDAGTAIDTARTIDAQSAIDAGDLDGLGAEATLVDRARVALRTNAPREALRVLATHERQFPRGQLAEERELLAIEAHVALRESAQARMRITRFRAAYPRSAHTSRIDELEKTLAP